MLNLVISRHVTNHYPMCYQLLKKFYILLTVPLSIIFLNDQLDAFFFPICLFQFSTCFEQPRAHHQENQLYQYNIWYVSLCVGERLVCRSGRSFPTCTRHLQPRRNWPTWASRVLITHPILRIWPRRTTYCLLKKKKIERQVGRAKHLSAPRY
jgi:hypothetical protein